MESKDINNKKYEKMFILKKDFFLNDTSINV